MFKKFRKEIKKGLKTNNDDRWDDETVYFLALVEHTKNKEIWSTILEYNKYDVSTHGRLRDTCSKEILIESDGDFDVNLINNYGRMESVKMSMLVFMAFFDVTSPTLRLKRAKNDEAMCIFNEIRNQRISSGEPFSDPADTTELDYLWTDTESD